MKVFVTKKIPQAGIENLLKAGFDVSIHEQSDRLSQEELIQACQDVDVLLNVGQGKLDETFFKSCAHLKGIALTSVGYDHVDLAAATEAGIPVSNTPDVLSDATADIAFLLMLAVSRKALFRANQVSSGAWADFEFTKDLGIELYGKTLGIFGLGRIGLSLARKAQAAYGMNIIYHNRNRNTEAEKRVEATYVNFDTLLRESDVLSLHTNLTPETQHRFNAEAFRRMKESAIFINTARGKIHHELDLIAALEQGEIWGAGLDVTDPEPMQADNPLLKMSSVCVFPHIGSATIETRTQMALLASNNLIAVRNGKKMPQVINDDVYRK
ncbi:2-hydroxyacid dehydrogenase [Sphingobacterium paludis]|uniref:Glyoxylate/hydroxypyruvate reductase B n=1 Tax=Sphingobacterium paludis TaxID=1476465 RepID=A0A4R7D944_9SPHI|nr:D-glycerate dehydrogenase [Sphingobacterium paludis]TDS17237.1 lactate dehydrogenase-like 2-hydroxyacid dehydrogenase [Sphingobacterium paludis]